MKMSAGGVWLVVYMTYDRQRADQALRALEEEGFLVRSGVMNPSASGKGVIELCVLRSEAEEAQKLLIEKGL